jgi:hypothetical protein
MSLSAGGQDGKALCFEEMLQLLSEMGFHLIQLSPVGWNVTIVYSRSTEVNGINGVFVRRHRFKVLGRVTPSPSPSRSWF